METTITLSRLWQIFKNAWWKIIAIALIAVIAAGAVTHFLLPRKYASSTTFIIVNVNQSIDYTMSTMLDADQQLAENYIEIIKSDVMLSRISEALVANDGLFLKESSLRKMISAKTSSSASTFTVTVTASDPTLAYKIACYIADMAPALVTEITKPGEMSATISWATIVATLNEKAEKNPKKYKDLALAVEAAALQLTEDKSLTVQGTQNRLEALQVLRTPTENSTHVSPSLSKNCFIVGAATLVLVYAFFLLRDLMNTTVNTEEDVKRLTDLPIIGTIPKWETQSKKVVYGYSAKGGDGK